ncbi:MAG: germination protein YpeB [Clostridia bacterium]|nr:germination protein YpeB [Clostridia bacterium]
MKKRIFIRVVSYLTAIILVFSVLIVKEHRFALTLENQVGKEYKSAYEELNNRLSNISILLKKALYSTSSQKISGISAEIYSETNLAKAALNKLSDNDKSHKILNRFLSQAGDYTRYLSDSLTLSNAPLTADQQENLRILSDFASVLSETVSETEIDSDTLNSQISELTERVNQGRLESYDDILSNIESDVENYPNIIYDGPYSDYVQNPQSQMLKDMEIVTSEYANTKANEVFNTDLKPNGAFEENFIEGYEFVGENSNVKISKRGGIVLSFNRGRDVKNSNLSYTQALDKAERYLTDNGYDNMRATYHQSVNNICIINFAYVDGQTLCYTDLIIIGVALDNGEIVSFDAFGFVINHKSRVFESLTTTEEQAREKLPPSLTVKASAIALIPKNSYDEVRCYEFLCAGPDDEEILFYINVSSLEIEEIFLVVSDDNGTVLK